MGIDGLLPKLKPIIRAVQISEYANQKVAVDTYCWLHRGAFSCSMEICTQENYSKCIEFCLHMVRMLLHYKIKPVLIFDGARLPSKSNKEVERHQKRHENLILANKYLQQGKRGLAEECFKKAVDITPQLAYYLIQTIKSEIKEQVECIVAPYEADAQLAYLSRMNYVSCVITEDSDLIPFGANKVVFKMNRYGQGEEYDRSKLAFNPSLSVSDFTSDMLIRMCILNGCDYLDSLNQIGIVRAHKIVKENKTVDRIMRALQTQSFPVTKEYQEAFVRAELTFKHQRVFDPVEEKMVCLEPLPSELETISLEFIGKYIEDQELVKKICYGEVDPMTHVPFKPFKNQSKLTSHVTQKIVNNSVPIRSSPIVNNSSKSVLQEEKEEEEEEVKIQSQPSASTQSKYFKSQEEETEEQKEEEEDILESKNLEEVVETNTVNTKRLFSTFSSKFSTLGRKSSLSTSTTGNNNSQPSLFQFSKSRHSSQGSNSQQSNHSSPPILSQGSTNTTTGGSTTTSSSTTSSLVEVQDKTIIVAASTVASSHSIKAKATTVEVIEIASQSDQEDDEIIEQPEPKKLKTESIFEKYALRLKKL